MPVYTYRGTNRAGTGRRRNERARTRREAQSQLRRQQITPSKMSEKGKEFNLPTFGSGVNAKDLAVFTRQFSVMIDAGLPLVQCLEILAGQQENKIFQKVLADDARLGGGRHHAFRRDAAAREGFRPLFTSTWWRRERRAVSWTPFSSALRPTSKRT